MVRSAKTTLKLFMKTRQVAAEFYRGYTQIDDRRDRREFANGPLPVFCESA